MKPSTNFGKRVQKTLAWNDAGKRQGEQDETDNDGQPVLADGELPGCIRLVY